MSTHPPRRQLLRAAIGAGAVLALPRWSAAQTRVTLRVSHFVAPTHRLQSDFLVPWTREIEQRTQGAVAFQISAANSTLGQAQNQLDQCLNGVVDVAFGLAGNPRGRMPRSMLIELPFMVPTADAGTRTLWALRAGVLAGDYTGIQPLLLMTHNAGGLHMRQRVEKPADLKGLRIRTPSPTVSTMLAGLGALPVGMPPTQIYENMARGVIDGAASTWDAATSFRLDEVSKYHVDLRFYTAAFWFGINRRRYESLPPEVRAAIDAASGDALLPKVQGWWDSWDDAGRAAARVRGNTVIVADEALRTTWRQAVAPQFDAAIADFEREGAGGAREIHAAMQRELARHARA